MRTTLLSLVLFGAACATDVVSLDGDCDDCADTVTETDTDADTDADVDTDTDTDTDADPDPGDEWSDYIWTDGQTVFFADDGFSDNVYLSPAFMVGYGGTLDWTLDSDYKESNVGGYFAYDTSSWLQDCYEVVLVSSLKEINDDTYVAATSIYDTADWWNNHQVCVSGSETADAWCAHQGGYDYLMAFCVTADGVVPNGDGI